MINAWIRKVRFKKSYKTRKNRKENRKTEQLLYLCIRKIELRTGLHLTFAVFRMRGCFARCTQKDWIAHQLAADVRYLSNARMLRTLHSKDWIAHRLVADVRYLSNARVLCTLQLERKSKVLDFSLCLHRFLIKETQIPERGEDLS